ncbi:hypothetical protein FEM48_Zijuj01G0198300 [Ziziphus jujuba var. spinosa]|uniref:DNA/RNA-binding protein Alba-like domain-containing protein n=1 Tax=Ziziphus jujuba var. spinosa TaxID=714518 RepID=A0A978W379_ZIZJJ|nr:hypothetical protein FEM48_Zijuj01G0198300 [Ziziphus jujuba var. spinosa]
MINLFKYDMNSLYESGFWKKLLSCIRGGTNIVCPSNLVLGRNATAITGKSIATVVTVAEILKNNGLAVEKKIMTSTVDMKDDSRGRPIQKARIEILLGKTENFDELMAAAAEEREAAGEDEDQS